MDALFSLVILVVFFAFFYFLIIRPQKKRQQQHQDLIRSLKRGDDVVTIGGICGVIRKVDKDTVVLETEGGTALKLQKNAIAERI